MTVVPSDGIAILVCVSIFSDVCKMTKFPGNTCLRMYFEWLVKNAYADHRKTETQLIRITSAVVLVYIHFK